MRPIRRGPAPQNGDFDDYDDAKVDLVSRLGPYCTYCERHIMTNLAVEHIQPQALYDHLTGRWENFLLACVNCNSTKLDTDITLGKILLPDRDNTFAAFTYSQDGVVAPATSLTSDLFALALESLKLTGLHKPVVRTLDANGKMVALDRGAQRMEAWGVALEAVSDLSQRPNDDLMVKRIVANAIATGFFSIWMAAFASNSDMMNRLINAFPGTRESGCFDPISGQPVTPAPNPDQLPHGSKI